MKFLEKTLSVFFFVMFILSCAKIGRPDGGPKDELAPIMVSANPPYESVNFNKKTIKLNFNEFIRLKNLNKQLVVSPPLKNPALISPQGTPSKFLEIKILDTLLQNTTYTFNFGNAIQDNNESNELENFKYVFSTGTYIDSLFFSGNTKNAFEQEKVKNVNIILHKIDSFYSDSTIYKQKPIYVSTTLDSSNFKFSNLKKGAYFVFALKEENSDYLFNSKSDEIAFLLDTIQLPQDSILLKSLELFKEIPEYKFKRAKELTKGHIVFGYEGTGDEIELNLLSEVPENFQSVSKFEQDKDTLNYWFSEVETDSLNFEVKHPNFIDTITVRLRKKKNDSLLVNSINKGVLHPRDTFFLETNNPIVAIDTSKISIVSKDSSNVFFRSYVSLKDNRIALIFDKKYLENYSFSIFPNALVDVFSQANDTLNYTVKTKELEDYGQITMNISNNTNHQLIVELIDEKQRLIDRRFIDQQKTLTFSELEPKKYIVRAIIDANKNNQWDTGNFLQKQLPERVIYFPTTIDVRPNYFMNETFEITY